MKKKMSSLVVALGLPVLTLMMPGNSLADDVKKFAGDWGCTFTSPVSFFGPLAGIALLNIRKSGHISGHETVASSNPFVLLEISVTGSLTDGANGMVDGRLTLTNPNFPTQTGSLKCIGTRKFQGQYDAMACLDTNDEPGDGASNGPSTDTISILQCERQ